MEVTYEVWDWVYLHLQPYQQHTLARRTCEILAPSFCGPFQVTDRIGTVAYKLQLPTDSRVQPVFHVSQFKRVHGTAPTPTTIPTQLNHDMEIKVEPEALLGVKKKGTQSQHVDQVLIKWRGLLASDATWEDYENIYRQFPSFHLEDKVVLWEGGNVTNGATRDRPIIKYTYNRCRRKDESL